MAADTPEYQGFIEGLFGEQLRGWCWQVGDDRPVSLELCINDRVVATFMADYDRGDLINAGIGDGRHGFFTPPVLRNIAADAVIRVRVARTDFEVTHSGLTYLAYQQRGPSHPATSEVCVVPQHSDFVSLHTATFPKVGDIASFRASAFANLIVEPAGKMRMPPTRVVNRTTDGYRVASCPAVPPDGRFPAVLPFPEMAITTLEDAFCLPFAPPFLPAQRNIVTDFLIPWAPSHTPWFNHTGGDIYQANVAIGVGDTEHVIDAAFYMDHTISEHFGHFLGDCLCRMYAWEVVRQIYGDVKLIIANRRTPNEFQDQLLHAAGAGADDIIRFNRMIRCKRLLLATQSLGVEQYASPTSARLWNAIRNRIARRDVSLPDRIYLTRSGVPIRRLVNETEVERIFERFGFTIVRPEALSAEQQIALVSNALLVAGPGGSGMFNLAFQGRLRSAFILVREDRVQLTEMLLCAGGSCDLWYYLGTDVVPGVPTSDGNPWSVDSVRLESDVADWVAASMG